MILVGSGLAILLIGGGLYVATRTSPDEEGTSARVGEPERVGARAFHDVVVESERAVNEAVGGLKRTMDAAKLKGGLEVRDLRAAYDAGRAAIDRVKAERPGHKAPDSETGRNYEQAFQQWLEQIDGLYERDLGEFVAVYEDASLSEQQRKERIDDLRERMKSGVDPTYDMYLKMAREKFVEEYGL